MNPDEPQVDHALLGQAQKLFGTTTTRDTLDLALSQAIQQGRRSQAVASELARFQAGRYAQLSAARSTGGAGHRQDPEPPGWPAGDRLPAPPHGYLIDTSALQHAHRPGVGAALHTLLDTGAAVTCPVLDLEALSVAESSNDCAALASARRLAYRSVPLTPQIGDRMLSLHDLLARRAHRGEVMPVELLVAATALEHGLRLVHACRAFTLLGELTNLDQVLITGHVLASHE